MKDFETGAKEPDSSMSFYLGLAIDMVSTQDITSEVTWL